MGRPEPAPLAEPWASMPGAESTSAELRRVQGELAAAIRGGYVADGQRIQALAAFSRVEEMRLKATRELASARVELDALRTLRDQILRDLNTARGELLDARLTIRALVGARTEPTEGAPPA